MKRLKLIVSFFLLFQWIHPAYGQQASDRFAEIGNRVPATRTHLLEERPPEPLEEKYLPVTNQPSAAFEPIDDLDTKKELQAELKRMRSQYKPFLADYAPSLAETRDRKYLREFSWREQTEKDLHNFASVLKGNGKWRKVEVPHFGPPLGKATTYYYKKFRIPGKMLNGKALFVHFKAVDYKADVFINGSYIGSHEGFFAPFEFNITKHAKVGENEILVRVKNDFTTTGSKDPETGERKYGNKIYAVTGVGYDDFYNGGHQCAPGMGIYQDVYIEARDPLHIKDIFVRPQLDKESVEVWYEINNYYPFKKDVSLELSVFGQNFKDTLISDFEYVPRTVHVPGVGDIAKPTDWQKKRLKMGDGVNFLKHELSLDSIKLWNNKTPWLYQLQVKLKDETGEVVDTQKQQFGMRSFTMDTVSMPKGRMYLNGDMTRLRGANTMGFLQQDVINKDRDQLIDDLLLAKIANMNFIRLTQRPVQPEIYEYADKLGMMLQTDLPLFGGLRTNQWAEAVKQAKEMERLVRNHPSNILVTYINERFVNAEGHPQRNMSTPEEYNRFFKAASQAVHMMNPDRVIKPVDGDYNPPAPGLPDHHVYNGWYNGHALELGKMHKGYFTDIKPGWLYGSGEFGAEGLDNLNVMKKYYPEEWLPQGEDDEKEWTANRIVAAQTQKFHYMWYNTQDSLEDWIEASQEHQAWVVKLTTEAFRRDSRMVSFAVHLFIDAWPAGWMKAIMDVDRQPKKAFYVYRNALKPLMVSLRTDRYDFYEGEEMSIEAWIANDLNKVPQEYTLKYQFEKGGNVVFANKIVPDIPINSSQFQGYIPIKTPDVSERTPYKVRLAIFDEGGHNISESVLDIEVFPRPKPIKQHFTIVGSDTGKAAALSRYMDLPQASLQQTEVILIDNYQSYLQQKKKIDRLVNHGKKAIFIGLSDGTYQMGPSSIEVHATSMGSYYFVSPQTGHPTVAWARPFDFKFWYDESKDYVTPFLDHVFIGDNDWRPILTSGLTNWVGDKGKALAAGELPYGKGKFIVNELELMNYLKKNPTASLFFSKLIE